MSLGYRGNDEWRDMSEYVVHFTKDTPNGGLNTEDTRRRLRTS